MNDLHRYSPSRRYASPLERPAPRSMLASPAFWIGGLLCLLVWLGLFWWCLS